MSIDQYLLRARDLQKTYSRYLENVGPIPKTKTLIFTCMDARISLGYLFGLRPGEAVVLRNAGAYLTGDMIRSIIIAIYELDVEQILFIGHTDCGLTKVSPNELKNKIISAINLFDDEIDFYTGNFEKWLKTFSDPYENVKRSIIILKRHPLIPKHVTIRGFVFDVKNITLDEVVVKEKDMEAYLKWI